MIQGSVLGPLLFLLYVNDVTDIFDGNCVSKLCADDIKLYSVVNSAIDCSDLQRQLNELIKWSDRWQLNISYKKCSTLFISNQRNKPQIDLYLGDMTVPRVESVKDLGVTIDNCNRNNGLKFHSHINGIVAKAHARANLIHRCFVLKTPAL